MESVDRRILGAFVCVDAMTGSSILGPLQATNPNWILRQNRSGVYVIFDGPNLDAQTDQFVPVNWPAATTFEVTIQDPQSRYLPRRAKVKAPQAVPAVTSANRGTVTQDPTTVFCHQPVKLYPVASAPVSPNWAVVRVSVTRSGINPPVGVPWALVQVNSVPPGTTPLAEGVTGTNGEAVLAVRGLSAQVSSSSSGPLTETTTPITVGVFAKRSDAQPQPKGWVSNPQDTLDHLNDSALVVSASNQAVIGAGQTVNVSFQISV